MHLLTSILAILLATALAWSANGSEVLNHYSILRLSNPAAEKNLVERFKAKGTPLFLVHDTKAGVGPGDILRFADKAVLVDASVLQTLQALGVLSAINQATVVRLQARASSSAWRGRAGMVGNGRERKGYQLGGELLQVLEEYFGGAPAGEELVLRFEGKDLVLYAPNHLLEQMSFSQVKKVPTSGTPTLVTRAPSKPIFTREPFFWQVWGVDPSEPESQLRYTLEGELPKGLTWSPETHEILGGPDSAGTWPLVVRVTNPGGRSDSLAFTIVVRVNQPPAFSTEAPPQPVRGQTWVFEPALVDVDHAGEDLRCRAANLPLAMELDSLDCSLTWAVPDSGDSLVQVNLTALDPLGDSATRLIELMPGGESPEVLSGIRFLLPRDTLTALHEYRWKLADWLPPRVELIAVEGQDSVWFDSADGGAVVIRPQVAGSFAVGFQVQRQGEKGVLRQEFQVRANGAPYFAGKLTSASYLDGDTAKYTPTPQDPDGDTLSYEAYMTDGRRIKWDGGAFKLWTGSPGTYSIEFRASDPYGAETRQRISYTVKPRPAEWAGIEVRNLRRTGLDHWWGRWRQGGARIGMYTNKFDDVFAPAPPSEKEWAFLTMGGTLLGAKGLARGDYLWVDAGLTLRKPSNKILTGGIYGSIDGRFTSADTRMPWLFEYEVIGHANQALLLVDTTGFGSVDYRITLDRTGNQVSVDDVDPDSLFHTYLGPAYRKILDDATDENNFCFSFRLEGWMPVYRKIWVGPIFWRDDKIISGDQIQYTGFGIRHQWEYKYFGLEHSLRMGWGGSAAPGTVYWDGKLSFGKWD